MLTECKRPRREEHKGRFAYSLPGPHVPPVTMMFQVEGVEADRIHAKAMEAGMATSTWLRRLALKAAEHAAG